MSATLEKNARLGRTTICEIVSAGYAYPSQRVDNDSYLARARFRVTDDPAKLIAETRMKARAWCADDENTWTLARTAVDRALAQVPGLAQEVDVVLVSSGTTLPVIHPAEAESPGMADLSPLVLRHLGRDEALGLDLKACYCSGFLRGLQVMDALLENPNYRAGLVVSAEQGSRFAVAETNQSSFSFLAGDAAGAVVLRRRPFAEGVGIIDYLGHTEASKLDWVGVGPDARSIVNKGTRAAEAVHRLFVDSARRILARNGLSMREVRWLLPLQTHYQLVEGLRRAVECPPEKLLWFGDQVGLSGSASIPSCFAEQLERGVIAKGDLILAVAVGAGLNSGAALFHA